MATNVSFREARDLQLKMEDTLLELERFGLLRETSADEIRTIVAEDIADKFDERYRCFPCGPRQNRLEIRRDRIPETCVLKTRIDERVSLALSQRQQQRTAGGATAAATISEAPKEIETNPAAPVNDDKEETAAAAATTTNSSDVSVGSAQIRVQNWVSGVVAGSSRSSSPDKRTAAFETGLFKANDDRISIFLANPPKLASARSGSAASSTKRRGRANSSKSSRASETSAKNRESKKKALSTVTEVNTPLTAIFPAGVKTEAHSNVEENAVQLASIPVVRSTTPAPFEDGDLISFSP